MRRRPGTRPEFAADSLPAAQREGGAVNLELTEDQEFFRETTRRFLDSEAPLTTVRALWDTTDGLERDWWSKAAELGWTTLFVPEAYGGGSLSGHPVQDAVIVAEEMGRIAAPGRSCRSTWSAPRWRVTAATSSKPSCSPACSRARRSRRGRSPNVVVRGTRQECRSPPRPTATRSCSRERRPTSRRPAWPTTSS